MKFKTVRLAISHNREDFSCGKDSLDSCLKKQVNQDIKRKLLACFVREEENHKQCSFGQRTNVPADENRGRGF